MQNKGATDYDILEIMVSLKKESRSNIDETTNRRILTEGITLEAEKKFTIPFCVPSENRKEPFSQDIELAVAFALSELDRAKGGGLIVRQPEEKIVFISKIGYPLWLIPWSDIVLVFDGLGKESYTLRYASHVEVKPFMDDLVQSLNNRETYLAFIKDRFHHIQNLQSEESFNVKGLMAIPEFLSEFDTSLQESIRINDDTNNLKLLTPIIDESALASEVNIINDIHSSLQRDIKNLNKCMKFLDNAAKQYVREVQGTIQAVKEEFSAKIKAEKNRLIPIVAAIKDEYNVRVTGSSKYYESQRIPIQKELVKLEKDKHYTQSKIEYYKAEAKKQAENNPAVEKKWKEKANKTKKELGRIEDQLSKIQEALKNVEERQGLETIKLKDELETKEREAIKILNDLEVSQEAKILIQKEQEEILENGTKRVIDQINKVVKLLDFELLQFSKVGLKHGLNCKGNVLFYIPFYITCFQSQQKERYFFLQPSVASTIRLAARLKVMMGASRIKDFMAPRFKTILPLIDIFQFLIEKNAVFKSELQELGAKASILNSNESCNKIRDGLIYLRDEGWLSEREYASLSHELQ